MELLQKVFFAVIGKKKFIGYIGVFIIAIVSFVLGESSNYIKAAICETPAMEVPQVLIENSPLKKDKAEVKPEANPEGTEVKKE